MTSSSRPSNSDEESEGESPEHVLPVDPDVGPFDEPTSRHRHASQPRVLAAIALGGFAGGLARYEIGLAFPTAHDAFPATTFAINVSGSFVLALLMVFVLEIWPPTRYVRPLFGVGFCGAYTTFSTWMVDSDRLISAGHYATAVWNLLGALVAGLAATSLGLTCGRAIAAHRLRREADAATERDVAVVGSGER